MRFALPAPRRLPLRIASKFFLVFAVLVPVIIAGPMAGISGLSQVRDEAEVLYSGNLQRIDLTQQVVSGVNDAVALALRLIPTNDVAYQRLLRERLATEIAEVDVQLRQLRRAHAGSTSSQKAGVEQLATGWRRFKRLSRSSAFDRVGTDASVARLNDTLALKVTRVLQPVDDRADKLSATEAIEASRARDRVRATYQSSRSALLGLTAFAVLVGLSAVFWLIRDIVPRIRDYSRFAKGVASGMPADPIDARGADELSELGRTLNEMVAASQAKRAYRETQVEFADAMQLTESEQEAHGLLKRHIERSIPHTDVVVLNRNNSHDRLEATTPVASDSPLREALTEAAPRSCLAVRFARSHEEAPDRTPLLECELCGKRQTEHSTCGPLLVGGEVIGSVLIQHVNALAAEDGERVHNMLMQAAPVLANLRNLALAEMRAATDALTGLPNNRSVQDSVRRMVAQALRSSAPLAAGLLDLDNFKQINDTYGHGKGDEVLAAVGATLQASVRKSDFIGRWGGEEFLLLLPDTDRDGAIAVAEKIREAITRISVVGVDRAITGSLGVAVLPAAGSDVATLTRSADRALYAAKARGRNRVEIFPESADGAALELPAAAG